MQQKVRKNSTNKWEKCGKKWEKIQLKNASKYAIKINQKIQQNLQHKCNKKNEKNKEIKQKLHQKMSFWSQINLLK